MTPTRAHLVERAVERLGGQAIIQGGAARPGMTAPPIANDLGGGLAGIGPARIVDPIAMDLLLNAGLAAAPHLRTRSRLLEELSIMQHQVLRSATDDTPRGRVVLVTSSLPAEGKTFIALNLAASIATSGGRRVVLVDADGKRGGISHVLGVADAQGLYALAMNPAHRPEALVHPTALKRLMFMAFGARLQEGVDLTAGGTMGAAVTRLAEAFPDAIVVLDTPPCLSTSDASALASIAGQVVMVVNAERTQRNEVEAALDMMEACPTLQLLLNRVRLTANDTFGAYGDYGAPDAG